MSAQHIPGRLRVFDTYVDPEIRDGNDKLVAVVLAKKANSARRLVACWNACEFISTESLESGQPMMAVFQKEQSRADRAEVERDELLQALKDIAEESTDPGAFACARAAIAKAGGEV